MSDLHPTNPNHATGSEPQSSHPRIDRTPDHLVESFDPALDAGEGANWVFEPDAPVLVSIRWKDAESQGGPTWEDTEEMLEFARRPLTIVLTVGVLLHIDAEQVAVTDTVAFDQMGGVTKIPRGWIERIDVLGPVAMGTIDELLGMPHGQDDTRDHHSRRVG